MNSTFYRFAVFLFVAFSFSSAFSQGREIKGVFSAYTQSVEVGDSCFIPQVFVFTRWLGQCPSEETAVACDSIYAFLKQNPSICIAIIVHSDFRPIPMTNDTLTERIANRVKEKILEYGDIDPDRIIAVGMGDKQLRVVTKEMHKQYKFLPMGQVLNAEFCKTITDNKNREIAIGFNRRTVVKIIKK